MKDCSYQVPTRFESHPNAKDGIIISLLPSSATEAYAGSFTTAQRMLLTTAIWTVFAARVIERKRYVGVKIGEVCCCMSIKVCFSSVQTIAKVRPRFGTENDKVAPSFSFLPTYKLLRALSLTRYNRLYFRSISS